MTGKQCFVLSGLEVDYLQQQQLQQRHRKYCKLCGFGLLHRNNPLVLGTNNSNLPRILQIFGDLFVNDVLSDDEASRKRVLAIIRQIQVSLFSN